MRYVVGSKAAETMNPLVSGILAALLFSGCAAAPFHETPYVSMESADPQAVLESFRKRSPERFQLLNTIVFQYNRNSFMAIGYIDVNTNKRNFMVTCINPMGVKLFELSGDKDDVVTHFAMPELEKKGGFASFVGGDIKRIYFNLIPSSEAKIEKKEFKITFKERSGGGVTEYIFAGADRNIVEKSYYEDDMPVWRTSYYEYRQHQGKSYPAGIIFKNYKYGYSLTVKLKEIQG